MGEFLERAVHFVVMSPPLNSFLLYCKDHRDIVKEANPGKHNSEISSILGKQWRGMSFDEKKKYKDLAKFRRKEYCKTNPFRMLKTPKKPVYKHIDKHIFVPTTLQNFKVNHTLQN